MRWQDYPCDEWPLSRTKGGYGKRKFRGKDTTAHRAAWIENYGRIPNGISVLHHCDNKPCREIHHLFLGTQQDNMDDMVSKDRSTRGERNNTTRLTDEQVVRIRELSRYQTQRELAIMFNVCKSTIGYILRKQTWKHI